MSQQNIRDTQTGAELPTLLEIFGWLVKTQDYSFVLGFGRRFWSRCRLSTVNCGFVGDASGCLMEAMSIVLEVKGVSCQIQIVIGGQDCKDIRIGDV